MVLRILSSLPWRRPALVCGGVVLALAAAACTPTYNWREMPAADGAIQVAFPGKPGTETRNLPMGNLQLPFTLTAVAAGGATFAVGHVNLPEAELDAAAAGAATRGAAAPDVIPSSPSASPAQPIAAAPDHLGEAMISSLIRHYPAQAVARKTVALRPLQAQRSVSATAQEIRAENPGNPAAPRLLARVFQQGPRWVQVVAVGPPDKLSWETAQWFVDSIRLP